MIISPSWGRRKVGNPRRNLHISVGDGVPSYTVWGYLTIFKKEALKFTNLKNQSDCFRNWTPGHGAGRPVLTPLGHWDTSLFSYSCNLHVVGSHLTGKIYQPWPILPHNIFSRFVKTFGHLGMLFVVVPYDENNLPNEFKYSDMKALFPVHSCIWEKG